jgi:hypothetical protein
MNSILGSDWRFQRRLEFAPHLRHSPRVKPAELRGNPVNRIVLPQITAFPILRSGLSAIRLIQGSGEKKHHKCGFPQCFEGRGALSACYRNEYQIDSSGFVAIDGDTCGFLVKPTEKHFKTAVLAADSDPRLHLKPMIYRGFDENRWIICQQNCQQSGRDSTFLLMQAYVSHLRLTESFWSVYPRSLMDRRMKQQFRFYRRRNGVFYVQHNETGKQESLKTSDRREAERLWHARNEAHVQPQINREIAQAYLAACDPQSKTRTWEQVMDALLAIPRIDNCLFFLDARTGSNDEDQPSMCEFDGGRFVGFSDGQQVGEELLSIRDAFLSQMIFRLKTKLCGWRGLGRADRNEDGRRPDRSWSRSF